MTKKPTTVVMPDDVRRTLQEWSTHNLTNMAAEITRSVRERREREAVATT